MVELLKKVSKRVGLLACTLMMGLAVALVFPMGDTSIGSTSIAKAATKVNVKSITMSKGASGKIKVTGAKGKVTYSTSNKKVVTVSKKGQVKAVGTGKATIKVKAGKKTYKVSVKVENPTITKTKINLKKGSSYQLKVKGTSRKVKWSTSNGSVATVNGSGKVTAKKNGQAIITAKLNDKKLTCKVIVGGKNVIVCPDTITMKYGEVKKVTLTAGDGFQYGTEDSNLLDVDVNPSFFHLGDKLTMTLTGKAVGTTNVVFKSNAGWTKKCKVVVKGNAVSASAVNSRINDVKVNSIHAYRSCNTKEPEIYIETSLTSNIVPKVKSLRVYYTFYNKSGKSLGTDADIIPDVPRGETFIEAIRVQKYSGINVNDIASIKITNIEGYLTDADSHKQITNYDPVIKTTSEVAGVKVTSLTSAKYYYYYYNNQIDVRLNYKIVNATSEGKSVKICYDAYDKFGNKIKQKNEVYEYEYIHAGQTLEVKNDNYTKALVGGLEDGRIATIVLRVVPF